MAVVFVVVVVIVVIVVVVEYGVVLFVVVVLGSERTQICVSICTTTLRGRAGVLVLSHTLCTMSSTITTSYEDATLP